MKRVALIVGLAVAGVTLLVVALAAQSDSGSASDLAVYQDPARLLALINDPPEDFFLVDVRTTGEYEAGHIPGALHHDYREIANDLPTEDRDALIVVYCRTGARSNAAARTLDRLGFTRVLDWGGIIDWPYEVVRGSEPR